MGKKDCWWVSAREKRKLIDKLKMLLHKELHHNNTQHHKINVPTRKVLMATTKSK